MKQKREREEPCATCGHYHDVANGVVCSVCGHRAPTLPSQHAQLASSIPTPILEGFLYLGSYDNASRSDVLKIVGITHILNCVPSCQVLFKNSFEYHTVSTSPPSFEECIAFIDKVRAVQGKLLVHCMTGQSRAPSVVMAYLMMQQRMSLQQAVQHVQARHELTKLTQADMERLQGIAGQQVQAGGGPFGVWPAAGAPSTEQPVAPPFAAQGPGFVFGS